jgi:hypothetical protein
MTLAARAEDVARSGTVEVACGDAVLVIAIDRAD